MPSSAPTRMCWLWVSGCTQLAVQWMERGQPLNTLLKQAPMCTLGVGGSPLLIALGAWSVLLLLVCLPSLSPLSLGGLLGGARGLPAPPFCVLALLSDSDLCLGLCSPTPPSRERSSSNEPALVETEVEHLPSATVPSLSPPELLLLGLE